MGFNAAREKDGKLVGGFATVWKVEDRGKYSSVQLSTSKKNQDGTWEQDFSAFVNFVGPAHEMAKGITERTNIRIRNCDVTKKYVKEQDKEYTNFAVFEFDFADTVSTNKPQPKQITGQEDFMEVPEDEEMPW